MTKIALLFCTTRTQNFNDFYFTRRVFSCLDIVTVGYREDDWKFLTVPKSGAVLHNVVTAV